MRAFHKVFSMVLFSLIMICSAMTASAGSEAQPAYSSLQDVPQSTWDKLAQKKIFFGHHSVGSNILQGVTLVLADHPNIKLNIISSKEVGTTITRPALVHGGVGKNFYPYTKIDGFRQQIEAGYGESTDIAFFKFCFVDFNPETDINDVFAKYKATMDELVKKYPDTLFAAVSTPLTCYAPGLAGLEKRIKDLIKKVIGKVDQYDHSSANRYNELLLTTYRNKLPVFDLARYESTFPDGSRCVVKKGDHLNYELVPAYTTDGGHLNKQGQRMLGEKFLLFLAGLAEESR